MNNAQINIRIVAFFYLIFNFIYIPVKIGTGYDRFYRSYDWIFAYGGRAEIDISRLVIQSIIIIIVLIAVNSPQFKKAENGEWAGYISFITWASIVPALVLFLVHYFNK